ncbi:MAG TPA: DJ-1/PfpI family protein [Aggregatilineales bacterium]|jgi:transcriptional regulator GlxA family with amidase domain|nr:DJ-1/PfpI family protein [Aggregatilineales bacterium]
MTTPRNVAILIFDQIEVLDFAGPYEVFTVAAELTDPTPFMVYTVAETSAPVRTRGLMSVNPNYALTNCPPPDILIIPGGAGTRPLLKRPMLIDWLRAQADRVELLLSVCTGSLLLARAGLLDGLRATTHHDNLPDLDALAPACEIVRDARYVDNGRILTAGGVSAGIDLALYVVRNLLGDAALARTLNEMEYAWDGSLDLKWPAALDALGG